MHKKKSMKKNDEVWDQNDSKPWEIDKGILWMYCVFV